MSKTILNNFINRIHIPMPCIHKKKTADCRVCRPCLHGRVKRHCKRCTPCPHAKLKSDCKICSPCLHGKVKRWCTLCNTTVKKIPKPRPKRVLEKRRITTRQRLLVASQQQWKCNKCLYTLTHVFQIDHITPISEGGGNEEKNLQALCPNCHAIKTSFESSRRNISPIQI